MLSYEKAKDKVAENDFLRTMQWLYCCDAKSAESYANRYLHLLNRLDEAFGKHTEAALFSAPGRTEIGGNHTDHQHGRVLAGSVNIDMIAAVAPNGKNEICVQSEGYPLCVIDLKDLEKRAEEENTTTAIIRGTCAAYKTRGAKLGGLDICVASNVPKGSGVSSSAAFEVLLGTILNELFRGDKKVTPIEIAQIGQWVENVYFGKPCGLMDQMASSVGGVVGIDFADPASTARTSSSTPGGHRRFRAGTPSLPTTWRKSSIKRSARCLPKSWRMPVCIRWINREERALSASLPV